MNVVYGLYRRTPGNFVDGELVHIRSPHEAIAHGIGMVHQHFMLVPTLTVAENVIRDPAAAGVARDFATLLTDIRSVERQIAEVAQRYGLRIDPAVLDSTLSVGEQQRVEIVKALYRGVNLLILDEPTAV